MNPDSEKKYTTISIPTPLANKVKERIQGTGFSSVSSYTTYVLRQIVSSDESKDEAFSKEDEERIKERLRSLGYID